MLITSFVQVFELYGSSRASLEVEFFAEVGSGLGPTLEFYALVSKEFARKDLHLWRDDEVTSTSSFVYNRSGLFPSPTDDSTSDVGKKRLKVFRVLGQFVAKGMLFFLCILVLRQGSYLLYAPSLFASHDGFADH